MFEALYTGKYVGAAMRLLLTAVPRESWVCMRVAKSCMYPCRGAGCVCVANSCENPLAKHCSYRNRPCIGMCVGALLTAMRTKAHACTVPGAAVRTSRLAKHCAGMCVGVLLTAMRTKHCTQVRC